jgi:predicted alpha/beta superfamily hydrolase
MDAFGQENEVMSKSDRRYRIPAWPAAVLALAAVLPAWGGPSTTPAAQAQERPEPLLSGVKVQLASKVLEETRDVWVVVPAGYENGQERYPVLIQLGDLAHLRYSVPIVDVLARNGHIPAMIVVACPDPTPRHHYRDSTPTAVDYLPASGGAPRFLKFLKEELIPYLEANFRTRPYRVLCGHGLSGLFAVYATLESPGTFGGVIADGASLTYDGSAILKAAEARLADPRVRGSIYFGAGNEAETVPGLQAFVRLLERRVHAGLEWALGVEADEDQGTAAVPVFHKGLKWLFRTWRIPVEAAAEGIDAVRAYYAGLSEKYGYDIPVTEGTLSGRGFQLIREQRFEDAAVVLEVNARAYPGSSRVYQDLATLYERTRDWTRAAESYERAAEKAGPAQPDLAKFYRAQAERLRKMSRAAGLTN